MNVREITTSVTRDAFGGHLDLSIRIDAHNPIELGDKIRSYILELSKDE